MSHREQQACQTTFLTDRGVLRVSGADAKTFLQGLITNNLTKTDDGGGIFAGLLSPQGKILFDFFLVRDGNDFLIEAPVEGIDALAKRLSFYKLRSAVTVEADPTLAVAAAWGSTPAAPDGALAFADPRLTELGMRMLVAKGRVLNEGTCAPATEADYHAHRIALGVPQGGLDYAYGETFPHEALYDQLGSVDFKKGCYVGQEVVSRMQHRSTVRSRIVPVEGDAPLESGAEVVAGTLPLGAIGSVNGTHGLALLRLDRLASAQAKGTAPQAGSTTITVRLPAFATFEMPVAENA